MSTHRKIVQDKYGLSFTHIFYKKQTNFKEYVFVNQENKFKFDIPKYRSAKINPQ